jgi:hypothetical protein
MGPLIPRVVGSEQPWQPLDACDRLHRPDHPSVHLPQVETLPLVGKGVHGRLLSVAASSSFGSINWLYASEWRKRARIRGGYGSVGR